MAHQQCKILLLGLFLSPAFAQDAEGYLKFAARTYKNLQSLQVEADAERRFGNGRNALKAVVTLYSVRPNKARVETKDSSRTTLQTLLISDGKSVTEYRPRTNEFTVFRVSNMAISFSPERGAGWGEMLYDTVAERVSSASIRGRQEVQIGSDRIACVVVDADYGVPTVKYTFWIATSSGLVLRRLATVWSNGTTETIVSTVRALTINEVIPDTAFEFKAPADAIETPL